MLSGVFLVVGVFAIWTKKIPRVKVRLFKSNIKRAGANCKMIITAENEKSNTLPKETGTPQTDFLNLLNRSDFWPEHRVFAGKISLRLSQLGGIYKRRGERMAACANILGVDYCPDCGKYHVRHANLCRDRACPTCNALRSSKLFKRVKKIRKKIGGRYLHLTLTIPNCADGELKQTMKKLSEGFTRFIKLKRLTGLIAGYTRTLEITRNKKENTWHPHIHVLLRVSASYFRDKLYIEHSEFLKLWRVAMKNDKEPLKLPDGTDNPKVIKQVSIRAADDDDDAVMEVCKYTTKSKVLEELRLEEFREWLEAVRGARLWTSGGCLKVSEKEIEPDEEFKPEGKDENICSECGAHMEYTDVAVSRDGTYKRLNYSINWGLSAALVAASRKKRRKAKKKNDELSKIPS